jgi:hypothetical protein
MHPPGGARLAVTGKSPNGSRRFASDPTTEALVVKITHALSSATRNLSPATPVPHPVGTLKFHRWSP